MTENEPTVADPTSKQSGPSAEIVRVEKCSTCMARDVDHEHIKRCAVFMSARAEAIAHGRGDTNIHAARTDDLWAHVNTRTGAPVVALSIVKAVIDLGWRPVIGHNTWTPTEADNG